MIMYLQLLLSFVVVGIALGLWCAISCLLAWLLSFGNDTAR